MFYQGRLSRILILSLAVLILSVIAPFLQVKYILPWMHEHRMTQLRDDSITKQQLERTKKIRETLSSGCVRKAAMLLALDEAMLERFGGAKKFIPEYEDLRRSINQELAVPEKHRC